jgi:polyhydroxybutyrate depolymerase
MIVLHGALGSSWSAAWDSRMTAQSEKYHFIVAYPDGAWRTWNAGLCCGPARRLRVDDVSFVRAMIDRFESDIPIEKNRIFATGISNGGMMAYRLGLELSDKLAAVVSIEGCMFDSGTNPLLPVSVLAIHGTKDKIIRYEGGTGSMFGYKVKSQSVAETVDFWVSHDNCKHLPIHEEAGSVSKDLYTGGTDGTEVCLYTLKGAGHAWPGGRRCIFLGDHPSQEFSDTDAICSFCLSHPKINGLYN